MTRDTTERCEEGGDYCGTPTGWRRGGRCRRCRTSHNADLRKYRGLTGDQRAHFLWGLRAGQSIDQAAASAGVTAGTVNRSSTYDGELRAALDGYSAPVQRVARLGDYLAALTRTGGDITLACQVSAVGTVNLPGYRAGDPLFSAAEQAILKWVDQATARPAARLPDSLLDEAARLLEADPKPTMNSVVRRLGVSDRSLRYAAGRHERLRAALPPVVPRGSGKRSAFTPEKDEQLRALWPDKNISKKELADLLGVSISTLSSRVSDLSLPRRITARTGRNGTWNQRHVPDNSTPTGPEA